MLWHHEAGTEKVKAFTFPPERLCIQLLRFDYNRVLECAVKTQIPNIYPGERFFSLPTFTGRGLACCSVWYRLDALSLHHGRHPQQGHYTSLLFERGCTRTWQANDGVKAKVLPDERVSVLAADAYLLWCTRVESC